MFTKVVPFAAGVVVGAMLVANSSKIAKAAGRKLGQKLVELAFGDMPRDRQYDFPYDYTKSGR